MQFGGKAWIRWPLGISAVVVSFRLAAKVVRGGGGFAEVGPLLLAVVLLIVAAVCLFPEVARAVALPVTRWIDSIYLPGGRPERAPLSFRLADYYEKTLQWERAVEEYQRILEDYPEEPEAYARLVRVLVAQLDDRRAARRWLKRGLRRISEPQAQARLREEFLALG